MNGSFETAEKILEDIPRMRHFSLDKDGRESALATLRKRSKQTIIILQENGNSICS